MLAGGGVTNDAIAKESYTRQSLSQSETSSDVRRDHGIYRNIISSWYLSNNETPATCPPFKHVSRRTESDILLQISLGVDRNETQFSFINKKKWKQIYSRKTNKKQCGVRIGQKKGVEREKMEDIQRKLNWLRQRVFKIEFGWQLTSSLSNIVGHESFWTLYPAIGDSDFFYFSPQFLPKSFPPDRKKKPPPPRKKSQTFTQHLVTGKQKHK